MSDSKKLRVVFFVVDENRNEVMEKKQIPIDLTEEQLKAADERDADKIKREIDLIGDNATHYTNNGRGKVIRDYFDAIGTIIGKTLENDLAKHYGSDHREKMKAQFQKMVAERDKKAVG
jgi:hypothetical protein